MLGRYRLPVCLIALFVALAAAHGSSFAQDDPVQKTASQWLADAQSASDDGRLIDAEKVLANALAAYPKDLKLLRLRGEVRLNRRDFEGALTAYEDYLAARPRGANRRKARKIISNLAAARTTQIEIKVASGEANVFLDAKSLGVFCEAKPTCKKGLLPGRYKVIVESDGFEPESRAVRLQLGKVTTADFALVEKPSPLTVTTVPADATVSLSAWVYKPGEPTVLPPGEYTVTATLQGYQQVEQKVKAERGKPLAITLALAEIVTVNVNVAGAAVSLDGTAVDNFSGTVAVPSDGKPHTLSASAPEYKPADIVVPAERERGQPISITLEPVDKTPEPKLVSTVTTKRSWTTQRKVLVGGLGVVGAIGLGVGTIAGLGASNDWGEAEGECDQDRICSALGVSKADDARSKANLANIGFGVGLAAFAAATWLWLTIPTVTTETTLAAPVIGRDHVGVTVRMGF